MVFLLILLLKALTRLEAGKGRLLLYEICTINFIYYVVCLVGIRLEEG